MYLGAFLLGNAAILSNVCMLPLYPGLLAYLASTRENVRVRHAGVFIGVAVLAGVLGAMLLLGFIMFTLGQSFSRILPWLLPLTYGIVLVLGVLLLLGKNPFASLTIAPGPTFKNPYASAFAYGGLLAPMTLPCTGPVLVSVFVLGIGSAAALGESLLYFLAFGFGFGWPLLVLPLFAAPLQRGATRLLAGNGRLLAHFAGVLLVVIALVGFWVEFLPNR